MMKKLLCTVTAVFGLLFVHGQDKPVRATESIRVGIKAGVNFATLYGDDIDDAEVRTAFHFGAILEIPVSENFSVQPELVYSSQGAKDKNSDDEIKGSYLNVHVVAKIYLADGFSLEVGPQIGFLLSAEQEEDGETFDIKDAVKSTDFAACLGLGYKMATGLNLAARLNLGLANISDFDNEDIKQGVIQLSVGYLF